MPNQYSDQKYASADSARADLQDMVVRLEGELDQLINMFAWARKALENEMLDGVGYKQSGLNEAFTKKLKELTIGMNSVVETKIKYDRAKKQMAKAMSPTEEADAVIKYLLTLKGDEWQSLKEKLDRRGVDIRWKS